MVQLRYIATGTGRSGTVGLATTLTSAGIPCSHERFFNGTTLDESLRLMEAKGGENSACSQHCGLPEHTDQVVGESSYMAAPYLDAPCFTDATIIHAVRNPWKVILSFLNNIQFFRGEPEHEHELFVYSILPQLYEIDNPVDRAVYYYIRWNRMIETLGQKRRRGPYIFHRVEDGSASLLRKLGRPEEIPGQHPKKNDVNAFKEWPIELRYLAPAWRVRIEHINACTYAAELHKLAKRYGYEAPIAEEAAAEPGVQQALWGGEREVRFTALPRLLEAGYRGYNLVRWRADCYALVQGGTFNLEAASEELLKEKLDSGEVVRARWLTELKARVDERISIGDNPQLGRVLSLHNPVGTQKDSDTSPQRLRENLSQYWGSVSDLKSHFPSANL